MSTTSRFAVSAALLLGGTSLAGIAYAQSTDTPATPATVPADAPKSTAAPAVADGEIIVTAQRREEKLQEVPATISAFSGSLLERTGIKSTKDLSQVTPGLNFTQSSFSPQPTIRGIGTRGVSPGDESVVPFYIDGVYQPVINNTVMDLNSVERIEVLKGPQGTLFGRNATGGAINIITRTPQVEPMADGSLSYARFGEVIGKGYVTAGAGPFAGDVAVVYRRDHGYIDDIVTGQEFGKQRNFSVRSKLRFEPSAMFDSTLILNHVRMHDSTPFATQAQNGNTLARRFNPAVQLPTGRYETTVTDSGELYSRSKSAALISVLHLDGIDITSNSSIQRQKLSASADTDTTPVLVGNQSYTNYSRSEVQDLYATGDTGGRFKWVVGGTFYHDRSGVDPQVLLTKASATATPTITDVYSSIHTNSIAGYAQGSYDVTDELNITVGGRYTHDRKRFFLINRRNGAITRGDKTWARFTPQGTIKYTFSPTFNIYAKAGQAFKAGIFPAATASSTPVNPETVTQYELGTKFGGSGLRANFAGYYTNYKNVQVNVRDPITLVSTLENAASAELYGIDGDLAYSPVQGLNLRTGIALLHGEYKNYKNAQITVPTGLGGNASATIDASGKKIIRTPFFTLNGGFDYTVPLASGNLTSTFNALYSGKSYWEASNRVVEPAKLIANGEVAWAPESKAYKVALFGENIFNEHYHLFVLSSTTTDSQVFAKPATYGVRVSVSFGR